MRGRKPKPIKRQLAEGDKRKTGRKKLEKKLKAEPTVTKGLPKCPRHLPERAKRAWRIWAEELQAMDLDKRPDAMMLEGACVNYARAVEADLLVLLEGMIVVEKIETSGEDIVSIKRRKHPAVEISNKSWILVRSFCSEFGLSPISRMRLAVNSEPHDDDDLAKLLSKPREPKPKSTSVH